MAWTDAAGDASGQGIQASIYNNAGDLVAGDIYVNTTTLGNQNEATLVGLADGGFVATWEDDNADLVRGQRFDALGHKIGVEYTLGSPATAPTVLCWPTAALATPLATFRAATPT